MRFRADVVKAIDNNDLHFFQSNSVPKEVLRKKVNGRSYLDLALIHQRVRIVEMLQAIGCPRTLTENDLKKLRRREQVHVSPGCDYTIKFERQGTQGASCIISTFDRVRKRILYSVVVTEDELKTQLKKSNVIIDNAEGTTSIIILESDTVLNPKLVLRLDNNNLIVSSASQISGNISIDTPDNVEFKGAFNFADLTVKANQFILPKEAICKAHDITFRLTSDLNLEGILIGTSLSCRAANLVHLGNTVLLEGFDIHCQGQAQLSGQLCGAMNSKIQAHLIRVNRESTVTLEQGLLQLVGTASVKNAGVIRSSTLHMESRLLVCNLQGAMIQAKSCIVPRRTEIFSNSGYYLVGSSVKPTTTETLLMVGGLGIEAISLFALAPAQTLQALRTTVMVSKTIYHANSIINKLCNGGLSQVDEGEWVHFFLSHVIPTMGQVQGEYNQARFMGLLLYQLWGWKLSEAEYIEKSADLLEMVIRGVTEFAGSAISDDTIKMLQQTANTICYSKKAYKVTSTSKDLISAYLNGSTQDKVNANDTVWVLGESVVRHYLQNIPAIQLFDFQISPQALASYVFDEGYELKTMVQVERLAYAGLYLLNQSSNISAEAKGDWQFGVQTAISSTHLMNTLKKYHQGDASMTDALTSLFSLTTMGASYSARRRIEPEVILVADEVQVDEVVSEENVAIEADNAEGDISEDWAPGYLPSQEELDALIASNADEQHVEVKRPNIPVTMDLAGTVGQELDTLQPVEKIKKIDVSLESIQSTIFDTWENGVKPEYAEFMQLLQKTFLGQGASGESGYLGIFANELHNRGYIRVAGQSDFTFESAHNAGNIDISESATLHGFDTLNRNADDKLVREADEPTLSQFHNQAGGSLNADIGIHTAGVGAVSNQGHMTGGVYENDYGLRHHDNDGSMHFKGHVDIRADSEAVNRGIIVGKTIRQEGKKSFSRNDGALYAQRKVIYASQNQTTQSEKGITRSLEVGFESKEVYKSGGINAVFVHTRGYGGQDEPESIDWRKGDDHISALQLNPFKTFSYDSDAFNHVGQTELHLQSEMLGKTELVSLDPNFANKLQVTFPESISTFTAQNIPKTAKGSTFILNAPGATFEATHRQDDISSGFHFKGKAFMHENQTNIRRLAVDVGTLESRGGESRLSLQEDSYIKADNFSNEGRIENPESMIFWNVDRFVNEAQLKEEMRYYIHSLNTAKFGLDSTTDQFQVEGSGSIFAKGHAGYIGDLKQTGGKLNSGVNGTTLYIGNSVLKPIFSRESSLVRGQVEYNGKSWWTQPIPHNSEMTSDGQVILLGDQKLVATGATIEGNGGTYLNFNQGVHTDQVDSCAYQKERAWTKKGRTTVAAEQGHIHARNLISDNLDSITIASSHGSVHLGDTVLVAPGDVNLISRQRITLEGREIETKTASVNKIRRLLKKQTQRSNSEFVDIRSSLVFVGGNLNISCLEFVAQSVQGCIAGDVNILAHEATFTGKQSSYKNDTVTKTVSIGLPTDNLSNILSSSNARDMFSALTQNCGWDPSTLTALLGAKNPAEIPGHLIATVKNVWDITALVAHSTNAIGDKDGAEFLGTMTDQLGLTVQDAQGNRQINTKVRLNWSKTHEHTESSETIASNLTVGGNFRMVGNRLLIGDGSKIDADKLILSLKTGIEMTSSHSTYSYKSKTNNGSIGVNVLNPKEVDVAFGQDKVNVASVDRELSSLNGRSMANIYAGEYIRGEGQITAPEGEIIAPEMTFTSVQSSLRKHQKSGSVFVSTSFSSAESAAKGFASAQGHYQSANYTVTQKAGITMQNGVVRTNSLQLNQGAILDVDKLTREDGEEGLPEVTGTVAVDVQRSRQASASISGSYGQSEGSFRSNYTQDRETTTHQPTVLAQNLGPYALPTVNTQRENISQSTSKHRGFSIAAEKINPDKFQAQKDDIQEAGLRMGKGMQRGLHFMFGNKQPERPTNSQVLSEYIKDIEIVEQPLVEVAHETLHDASVKDTAPSEVTPESLPQEIIDDQFNGQMSVNPILAELQGNPTAQFYLAQLSSQERADVIRMVEDYRNGVPNFQLNKIISSLGKKEPTIVDDFLRVINPIGTAHANPVVIAYGAYFLLGALGVITIREVTERAQNRGGNWEFSPLERDAAQLPEDIYSSFSVKVDSVDQPLVYPIHQPLVYPIHQPEPPIYVGISPDAHLDLEQNESFPARVDQEPNILVFPVTDPLPIIFEHPIQEQISGIYYRYQSSNEPDYQPNEKHRQAGPKKASIDPFYHQPQKAERLLHEAIEKGYQTKDGKQYYAPIRDAKGDLHVFVFQPTHNDGREYHGYLYETSEGENKVNIDIRRIAKDWKDNGTIDRAEYKKIINNKMDWAKGPKKEFR